MQLFSNSFRIQKKTSTMSLTISSCSRDTSSSSSSSSSSTTIQRHSSLVQPVCISPQMVRTKNTYAFHQDLKSRQVLQHKIVPSNLKPFFTKLHAFSWTHSTFQFIQFMLLNYSSCHVWAKRSSMLICQSWVFDVENSAYVWSDA